MFACAWEAGYPLRIGANRAMDIAGALRFVSQQNRPAYIVGALEADQVTDLLAQQHVPVVLRVAESYRQPADDIGFDPHPLEPDAQLIEKLAAALPSDQLALAGPAGDSLADLRLAAIFAVRGGLSVDRALAAITRVPAEILGVGARVGSIAPGYDADMLVMTGPPLDINSHVRRVYIAGRRVFDQPAPDALVVRAGSIWVGDGRVLHDASLLIEKGKIAAVGQRVPHPPGARIIDAGADAMLTPGFIDSHGHLGLEGDRSNVDTSIPLDHAIAVAGRDFARVARAGVTTVLLAPERPADTGARMTAIKTWGDQRDQIIAKPVCAVRFSIVGNDPLDCTGPVKGALEAGKKYVEKWKKYEEELAKWKQAQTEGKDLKTKPDDTVEETITEEKKPDPITGTWEYTVSGDPMPEPVSGNTKLKLIGNKIQGRISDPGGSESVELTGTLDGDKVHLQIDVPDSPIGNPKIEATLDHEDHMTGQVVVEQFQLGFEANRTDKSDVEFKVERRRGRRDDGRPEPPKVDQRLEPYRDLLAGNIPVVVEARTAREINAITKLVVDEYKLPLVLLNADDAEVVADELIKRKDRLGIVVPPKLMRQRHWKPYCEIVELGRLGIPVAFQSGAQDGARALPNLGAYAVEQGLGGDDVLRALTVDAARMFKLSDQLGTLEPGRDGDVLVFSGYPFDAGTRLERVIVSGQEVRNDVHE